MWKKELGKPSFDFLNLRSRFHCVLNKPEEQPNKTDLVLARWNQSEEEVSFTVLHSELLIGQKRS